MNKKRSLRHRILLKASAWVGRRQSRSYKRLRDKAIAFDLLMGMPEADLARIYHVSIDTVRHAKRRAPKSIYIQMANLRLEEQGNLSLFIEHTQAGSPPQEGNP